ncbi:MAG: DegT/DnrJ/EryC1/StrS family aminotransferase [Candidatus Sericytochromatia bacterium]
MPTTDLPPVPILDPMPEVEALWEPLMAAVARVFRSGSYIMGPEVVAFEREMADYLGVRHAIGVNSGTDALVLALDALGVGPGDEVITTPFTFFATAEAVSRLGATPVFVDIDPVTLNLDPRRVESAITRRTRALLPVHLFGRVCDMVALSELAAAHGLHVVEDVAQALGASRGARRAGTFGHVGAYSFFPSKNLGAAGDGGLVTTDDPELAERVRMLRTHGAKKKYHNEILGYNSRLDELQAAILRVKLPRLDRQNALRREAATRYGQLLAGLGWLETPAPEPAEAHVYHQYTVRVAGGRRDALQAHLAEAGVQTMIYYPVAVHKLPVYAPPKAPLPVAEAAQHEVLSLPIWPGMPVAIQERVAAAIRAFGG